MGEIFVLEILRRSCKTYYYDGAGDTEELPLAVQLIFFTG